MTPDNARLVGQEISRVIGRRSLSGAIVYVLLVFVVYRLAGDLMGPVEHGLLIATMIAGIMRGTLAAFSARIYQRSHRLWTVQIWIVSIALLSCWSLLSARLLAHPETNQAVFDFVILVNSVLAFGFAVAFAPMSMLVVAGLLMLGGGVLWGLLQQMAPGETSPFLVLVPVFMLYMFLQSRLIGTDLLRALLAETEMDRSLDEMRAATRKMEQSYQESVKSSEQKTVILARTSHELRTPLNNIVGTTELLLCQEGINDAFRSPLKSVYRSSRHLLKMLNDLLDLSSMQSAGVEAQTETIEIRRWAENVVAMFRGQCAAKNIEIRAQVGEDMPSWIKLDVLRLNQVVNNLIGNAIKFTEEGAIELELRLDPDQPNEQFVLSVSDSGCGIPEAFHNRLFEPFEQGSATVRQRHGGAGLGLAITRTIIEGMGGSIDFESVVGAGTRFFVFLPLVEGVYGSSRPRSSEVIELMEQSPSDLHVLHVDDNTENRALMQWQLNHLGYQVSAARNGIEALQLLSGATTYDLILLDCQMPDLDGYETARRIRKLPGPNQHTPIIAVTAHAMADEMRRCLEAGMDDHLEKPLSLSILATALRKWLRVAKDSLEENDVRSETPDRLLAFDRIEELRLMAETSGVDKLQLLFSRMADKVSVRLSALHQAMDFGQLDADEASTQLHELRGMGLAFGMQSFGASLGELEQAAKAGELPEKHEWERVCELFESSRDAVAVALGLRTQASDAGSSTG